MSKEELLISRPEKDFIDILEKGIEKLEEQIAAMKKLKSDMPGMLRATYHEGAGRESEVKESEVMSEYEKQGAEEK